MEKKQRINCNVSTCQYNKNDCVCTLDEIKVGCQCGCHPHCVDETVCDSYKKGNC